LSLLGLSIVWTQAKTLPIGIGFLFILAIGVLRFFHSVKDLDDVKQRLDRLVGERREVQYALLQAQLLNLEVDRCQSGAEFWALFAQTLRRVGFVDPGETDGEIVVHVKYNGCEPWTLHAPATRSTIREWQRIAECFRPVYVKARAKWQP
jgi:hypothetical protein